MNKLIVHVEEGDIIYDGHEGDWLTDGQLEWLTSVFDYEVGPGLEMEPDAGAAIRASEANTDRVFLITIHEPCCVTDEGYWDMNYGYVNAEIHLEWNGPVEVQELGHDAVRCQ